MPLTSAWGVPDRARQLAFEAFEGAQIQVETRWGPTRGIALTRGAPQGSVSAPDLAKPAQEPILRLRETSTTRYVTSAGRAVASAGYVDDAEHYGSGAADLAVMVHELGVGSGACGIGFSWRKSSAYASDWDVTLASAVAGSSLRANGVIAEGWDIWHGGFTSALIARVQVESIEKLLGKRGAVKDRHSKAREDVMSRIAAVRKSLVVRRASWDEIPADMQLVIRGVMGYAPLIGPAQAPSLHLEEAEFQRLLLQMLGVRGTVERVSLLARRTKCGAQLMSVVECAVSAMARVNLLNGDTQAALLARDSLRHDMFVGPAQAESQQGLVTQAMRLLAGYGVYISVSTDRTACRLLDAWRVFKQVQHQHLVGPYDHRAFEAGASLCRVGVIANALRRAVRRMRQLGIRPEMWEREHSAWEQGLDAGAGAEGIDVADCVRAARLAASQGRRDWQTELSMFSRARPTADVAEDWTDQAWENPLSPSADARSTTLDGRVGLWWDETEVGLFGDVGFYRRRGATFAAQARAFGTLENYWLASRPAADMTASRMPARYGYEAPTIHTAELAALIASLRWRRPGCWNLFVGDRSALFSAMERAASRSPGARKNWRARHSNVGSDGCWPSSVTRGRVPRTSQHGG